MSWNTDNSGRVQEQENGPNPQSHATVHLDGDRLNYRSESLTRASGAEQPTQTTQEKCCPQDTLKGGCLLAPLILYLQERQE